MREADRFASARPGRRPAAREPAVHPARADNVVAGPLAELLAVTYGPTAVLGEILAYVPGVNEAYLYGSWAARYRGHRGDVPRDVDVLAVGNACRECSTSTGRHVARCARDPRRTRLESLECHAHDLISDFP